MTPRRELAIFGAALAVAIAVPLGPALIGHRVLSPSDLAYVQRSFDRPGEPSGYAFEPANRLLTDPMLQFEPWIEFNRAMFRQGRLPLWNGKVGCGAPHLANGQSAPFDPFLLIAYLGPMPGALAWVAAARLWVAGLGMFVLARAWGLGPWGRWFAGLCYPGCGFMTLWLLYPLASVAAWLPWLLAASARLVERGSRRAMAAVAAFAAAMLLGGHVQTAAHGFLLASVGVAFQVASVRGSKGALARWAAAMTLGVATAAVAVVPLGVYLSRSPVWRDRGEEMGPPWELSRPRLLEAACTAVPDLFGGQRRGQPNLAKAIGVDNVNESAGGFAGLATLIWLAPVGLAVGRGRTVSFLATAAAIGALASAKLPPADTILRLLPVLDVTDHRRMALWVAFGLVGLGAIGLDRLHRWEPGRRWRAWVACWAVGAAAFAAASAALPTFEEMIRDRALAHYEAASARSDDLSAADAAALADRQVRNLVESHPGALLRTSTILAGLAALASWAIGRPRGRRSAAFRALVLSVVLADLASAHRGAFPMIDRDDYRPAGPVIEHLRREASPPARILAVGAELPPNMLMRYGLADVRNYDAIELIGMAEWLDPLFEEGGARSSRREVTWEGVARARDRLEASRVSAVVGASPPPVGLFDRVVRVGSVWVGHWELPPAQATIVEDRDGRVVAEIRRGELPSVGSKSDRIMIPIAFVPGWRARCDLGPLEVSAGSGPFLWVRVPAGGGRIELTYDPLEVRMAMGVSLIGMAILGVLATGPKDAEKGREATWTGSELGVKIDF
ncbi:hypothetical protein [Tautonia sociabilis]|uniref:YfhO family protein n=1 Tax=Tautonia sociabilis TaxID=2080755 RepID=A0A432MGI9_9BACT|nr:hypothetical protein [Tautonia sociabilis]RUL85824.1 hypothetical protein TsocGM_17540 [Tautonia sociabilis]